MCPFLLNQHCSFEFFSIRPKLGKPFIHAAPTAVIALIDRDGVAGFVGQKMCSLRQGRLRP